jgi:uncharacterized pyridoxamine 5'-phosphate oxidase family protein
MRVETFAEIEPQFIERAHRMVWCNVATVDDQGRPRSRILHPIWEGSTAWILTYRNSPKGHDLARNPYVSLAYVSDWMKPAYAECRAEWVDDLAAKQRVWDLFKNAPPPLGYDPGGIWQSAEHQNLGLLRLTPWRVQLTDIGQHPYSRVWEAE